MSSNFFQGSYSIWHYRNEVAGTIQEAAAEACANANGRVVFFWWNGTFAPMKPEDTSQKLVARWERWTKAHQCDPLNNLLELQALK